MDLTLTVQQATIAALEALSDPARRVTVEAWAMTEPATEDCSHDYLHGRGDCYGPTGDPLCLACMNGWIEANTMPGNTVSVDVAR